MNFTIDKFYRVILTCLLAIVLLALTGEAIAHPEDDFCGPDSGIDPQLCRQLSEMNSADAKITKPLLDEEGNQRSALDSAWFFLKIGVQHILPGGMDHILFVLALFLVAQTLKTLVLQISIFTIAHTATLGLTAAGVIQPSASIVEPLIALSIALVALETLLPKDISRWRPLVIFGFGLFHGMGFAGYIKDIGLPPEQFWPSLIGFNVGVEIGQLSVVFAAVLLSFPVKYLLAGTRLTYRNIVVMPLSSVIAAIGLWWFVERSLGL